MNEHGESNKRRTGTSIVERQRDDRPLKSRFSDTDQREITVLDLWDVLWAQRFLVIALTASFAVGAIIISLILAPIYRSDAVLAPISPEESSGLVDQLGGLASLAGVHLGGSANEKTTTIAILRSRAFAASFISDHELLPMFFNDEWDAANERWLTDDPGGEPTLFDAIKYFRENVFSVQEDATSGLLTIAVEWTDPGTAMRWVNELADRINEEVRERALREADQNLSYLSVQLEQATVVELRAAISRLIEAELQTLMLARVREEYAFKVVDPGMEPTKRVRPKRTLIVAVTTVFGGMFAVFVALIRHSLSRQIAARKLDNPSR